MERREMLNVPMSTDEHGFFGRECPSCKKYFKLKPVTDFTTTQGICPYCGYTGELQDFITQDQHDYLTSIAANESLVPMLRDFANSLKGLETSSNDFVQFKVNTSIPEFPIQYYPVHWLPTASVGMMRCLASQCPARHMFCSLLIHNLATCHV